MSGMEVPEAKPKPGFDGILMEASPT